MIDIEAITERVDEIRRRRSLLEDYKETPFQEFTSDLAIYELAIRHLQVALEASIDIGKHIAAAKNLGIPEQPSKVFSLLAENKIINRGLAQRLNLAGGARNVIVHSYLKINLKKIYSIIQNDLPDLDQFVHEIGQYLKKEK